MQEDMAIEISAKWTQFLERCNAKLQVRCFRFISRTHSYFYFLQK